MCIGYKIKYFSRYLIKLTLLYTRFKCFQAYMYSIYGKCQTWIVNWILVWASDKQCQSKICQRQVIKRTGSRYRIQMFGQKWKVQGKIRTSTGFWISKDSLIMMILFPTFLRWQRIGEITFIGEIPTKFLCGPCFLLVQWLNCRFLLLLYSFQNPKRLFEGYREIGSKICPRPSNMFYLFMEIYSTVGENIFQILLENVKLWFWRKLQIVLFLQYVFTLNLKL